MTVLEDCTTLHFPTACPKCEKVSGMPYLAKTVRGNGVEVSLRCLECGHPWGCTLSTPHAIGGPVQT